MDHKTNFQYKYAPRKFNEIVFNNAYTKNLLGLYAQKHKNGHLIFWGSNGTGKTTTANLLPIAIEGKHVSIHAIQAIEIKNDVNALIQRMISHQSFADFNGHTYYAIVEELDFNHINCHLFSQHIEKIKANSMVIICTNSLHAISAAIKSRCTEIEFEKISAKNFLPRAKFVLKNEGYHYDDEIHILNALEIESNRGDSRKYLDILETLIAMKNSQIQE